MNNTKFGIALLMAAFILLPGCLLVPDSGEDSGTTVDIVPVPDDVPDPSTYVCNPLDGESPIDAPREQGIRGMLYYLDPSQPHYNRVEDYLTYGTFAQAIDRTTGFATEIALYFNQLFIPTRPFDRGFVTAGGQTLQTPNGDTLYEYFAIRHEGRLQLGSKPEGLYQLAILSDDGATLKMDFGSGMQTVIDNDGDHPTRMGCAVLPVEFSSEDKIPYVLDYYQGPRYHISLIFMWRPATETQDEFCGRQGNSFYFDSTQDPPAPTVNYNSLLSRGWEPIAPENYLLPEVDAVNPCNEPAPVISGFSVVSITANSVTLSWDTDRSATSQVYFRKSVDTIDNLTSGDGLFYSHHVVTVTGLSPNTDYVMRAMSSSSSGLTSESAPRTIRTRR
ncbi:MAG: fibronectin type III domain-containing protein [Bdellovibrionales bacterium]|nr:fibronectin type III domain-containing protein [Bdellovibrionales bacterium]